MKANLVLRPVFRHLAVLLILAAARPVAHADDYAWSGPNGDGGNGDFSSADWFDQTTNKANTGPPGGGDNATISDGAVVTCSGGSVNQFSTDTGTLDLAGSFSVNSLGNATLTGSGTLTASSLEDGVQLNVTGATVTAGSAAALPFFYVDGGGSVVVKSNVGSGASTVTGKGSSIECDGSLADFNGTITDGGKLTAQGITTADGLSGQLECDGSGTVLSLSGDATISGGFLSIASGAQATIGGRMDLHPSSGSVFGSPGSLSVIGAGTKVTIGGTLELGPGGATALPVGTINVETGALLHAYTVLADSGTSGGSVSVTGGSVLQVDFGLDIGDDTPATLQVSGQVLVTGSTVGAVGIGLESGGNGTATFDGSGTLFNTGLAEVALGRYTGSVGSVTLSDSAVMQVGSSGASDSTWLHVGDGGNGTLNLDSGAALKVLGVNVPMEIGSQAEPAGTEKLNGTGTVTVGAGCTMDVAGSLTVGNLGYGTLNVEGAATVGGSFYLGGGAAKSGVTAPAGVVNVSAGGSLIAGSGDSSQLAIGEGMGSIGKLYGDGSGAFINLNGPTIIGLFGDGLMTLSNGAAARIDIVSLGSLPGSLGTLSAYYQNTTIAVTFSLFVGGTPVSQPAGNGLVTVDDDALLTVGRLLFISPTGSVDVASSPLPDGTASGVGGRIFVGTDNFGPNGTIRVGHGGVLKGKGKQVGTAVYAKNVIGNVYVGVGGTFRPGGDPDVFNIVGDCDLSDGGAGGGETEFEIGGTGTAGTNYDQLIASGTVTLGGTLDLVLMPGYKPKVGDQFNFVQGASVAGGFAKVNAPGLAVSSVPSSGALKVTVTSVTPMTAPRITSVTKATGSVGTAFEYQIAATNTPGGYVATGLPDGLDLDPATGLISGTPTTAGTYAIALQATNTGGTGAQTLTLTVDNVIAGAPVITSAPTADATLGTAFSYQIAATNTPTSYGAKGLPAGLTLVSTKGLISGKPTTTGTFPVTLSATNAAGTGTATLTLTIDSLLPTVTVVVDGDGMATFGSENGKVSIERTGDTSTALTVLYKVVGSAKAGVDYTALPGSVTIPAGASKKKIKIKPLANDVHDGTTKAKLKLLPASDGSYTVGSPAIAKIKIIESD